MPRTSHRPQTLLRGTGTHKPEVLHPLHRKAPPRPPRHTRAGNRLRRRRPTCCPLPCGDARRQASTWPRDRHRRRPRLLRRGRGHRRVRGSRHLRAERNWTDGLTSFSATTFWSTSPKRRKLLTAIARWLAPRGIAFVAFPAWPMPFGGTPADMQQQDTLPPALRPPAAGTALPPPARGRRRKGKMRARAARHQADGRVDSTLRAAEHAKPDWR